MNYKLTIYPVFDAPGGAETYTVTMFETRKEMLAAKETCSALLLFLQDMAKIMPDHANVFLMEEKNAGGDWHELEE